MVNTRDQLEAMSKEELIEKALAANFVIDELREIKKTQSEFVKIEAELKIVKNCNTLLHERVIQLEKDALNTSQYVRKETMELGPLPSTITDDILEKTVCDILSLTGQKVTPNCLQACHRMKDRSKIILRFCSRKTKHSVITKRRILKDKVEELKEMNIHNKVFLNDSMCMEVQRLFYLTRKLAKTPKVHKTWFFNNTIYITLSEDGDRIKIFHSSDLEKILGISDVYIYLRDLQLIF